MWRLLTPPDLLWALALALALAGRLRQETTLTMGWIAKRLQMGTRKSVVTRLQEVTRQSRE